MRHSSFLPVFFGSLLLFLVFLAAGCTNTSGPGQSLATLQETPVIPDTTPSSPAPASQQSVTIPQPAPSPVASLYKKSTYGEAPTVVEANNQFAAEMYNYLRQDPQNNGRNIFYSPFSLSSALAITYDGARGTTADEIGSVFHFPRNDTIRQQQFYDINAGLNTADSNYTLRTANALWAEKTHPFLAGFTGLVSRYYGAETTNLDFINHPEDSRLTINGRVENQTANYIRGILPPGSIKPEYTRLVITNAIFFNGKWKYEFSPGATANRRFFLSPYDWINVSMMTHEGKVNMFNYTETDRLQAVEMPYSYSSGRELSMLVILPKEEPDIPADIAAGHPPGSLRLDAFYYNLTAVEESLDGKKISELRAAMRPELVVISMPKFKFETQYEMTPVLENMGMPVAFTDESDLSGMDGTRNLSIDTILHKAYVDVDEKGTTAAAATAVGFGLNQASGPTVITFNANHPFIFIIQDRENGNILFIGRVMNPNQTG